MDLHIYTVRESTTDQIDLQDPLFSDVMPSTLTADNLFSMDPVPYSTPRRGWCRCCQCYTRHKEEQLLYESDSTSVIEPVCVWRDTLETIINDSAAPLNPPIPPYIAPADGIVIPDVDDEVSINTISVLGENCHVTLRCIFYSGANHHHIFNDELWVMGTNSPLLHPQPPLFTASRGIFKHHTNASSAIKQLSSVLLQKTMLSQFPSIVTTFSSVDNTFRVTFGATTFTIPMASDLLYYISKDQVKLLSTHVTNVTQHVTACTTTAFSKEQLSGS
jgi:hypothetical protein